MIQNKGLGKIYTTGANLKGIAKYSYSESMIAAFVRELSRNYKITRMNTYGRIPFAMLIEAEKCES